MCSPARRQHAERVRPRRRFAGRGGVLRSRTQHAAEENTKYEERLKQLADAGVTLSACQNAMRFMNVKTEDLFPFAAQVDSGVAEVVRRQEAGWAYIH